MFMPLNLSKWAVISRAKIMKKNSKALFSKTKKPIGIV